MIDTSNFLFTVPNINDHADDDYAKQQAADLLASYFVEDPTYEVGDVIFWQGESASTFCAIESGAIETLRDGEKLSKVSFSAGCGLDEVVLCHATTRYCTARCLARARVWRLERQTYRGVLARFAAQEHGDRLGFLNDVQMLKSFSQATLTKLASCLKERTVKKNNFVFRQGDPGDAFFICKRGRVLLLQSNQEIARCEEGDAFGERSLHSTHDEPRAATAKADEDTVLYYLEKKLFLQLLGPGVELMEIEERIRTLKSIDRLFSSLAEKHLDSIARAMTEIYCNQGDIICRKGEAGDAFYVIKKGAVQVMAPSFFPSSSSSGKSSQRIAATLSPGAFFGETALLSDDGKAKREADVYASKNDTILLKLQRADFDSLLGSLGNLKEVLQRESERRSADLRKAVHSRFSGIINTVTASRFVITSPKSSSSGSASSKANPPAEDEKSNDETDNKKKSTTPTNQQQLRGKATNLVNLRIGFKTPGIGSTGFFDSLQDIAWPAYQDNPCSLGNLFLVRSDETTCCYTLRVIRKSELLIKKHDILAERELLTHTNTGAISSQWLPSLRATASDRDFVYLLFDELPGGDLYSHLHDPGAGAHSLLGGDTKASRHFAGQALAAIEYLHARDIAHRAISPEAFLIGPDGRLVLFDLICAKPLPQGARSNTFCGVPDYMAPEVITAQGHGLAADLWALGILIFELVTRKSLFASKRRPSPADLFSRIVKPEPILARVWSVTSYYGKLVASLLKVKEEQRAGMSSAGFRELWEHKFFKSVNKEHVLDNANPPWIPLSRSTAPLLDEDAPSSLRWRSPDDISLDDYSSDFYQEEGGTDSPVVPLTYLSAF
uniref:cGMP-dependent protein kinase n=1 Tax=Aureoumbra lagunensis TaxID=44058 RepID=A0A7S3NFQ5_9STRA